MITYSLCINESEKSKLINAIPSNIKEINCVSGIKSVTSAIDDMILSPFVTIHTPIVFRVGDIIRVEGTDLPLNSLVCKITNIEYATYPKCWDEDVDDETEHNLVVYLNVDIIAIY